MATQRGIWQKKSSKNTSTQKQKDKRALRSAQNVYYKLKIEQTFKDVTIGYDDPKKRDCEISLNQFDPNILAFERITYYRTGNKIIWSKELCIDLLFNSGDTKLKISQNPNIIHITEEKLKYFINLPLMIKDKKNKNNAQQSTQKTALRTAQNVFYKLMIDKTFKDVVIGYKDHSIGDCEFSLDQFDQNEHAFERISYYRTDTQIIWNKQSRIDLLFNSGDTILRIKSNPKITNVTLENAKNMPSYVRKYILQQNDITDNDQSDDECSETSKNEKSRERVTHFLSIRIKNPLLIALATEIQNDIIKEYKKQRVRINTSLIKEIKFHISINVISLPTDDDVNKFVKILKFIQQWLNVYVFAKKSSSD